MALYYNPLSFLESRVTSHVVLFYSLEHFYTFKDIVQGGKVKSFGLAKKYFFTIGKINFTAIGGMIGAAIASFSFDLAIANGATFVFAFGSVGSLESDSAIGDCVCPVFAVDFTGISQDYNIQEKTTELAVLDTNLQVQSAIASISHPLTVTIEKLKNWKKQNIRFLDMEVAPLAICAKQKKIPFYPLFICSDVIIIDGEWRNERGTISFQMQEKQGLALLAAKLQFFASL